EQRNFADVGAALGATAEAARKRVDRALDRLRDSLARRGVTTTAAALGGALTTHAVQVAPAGLAATLAGNSLAAVTATTAAAGAGWLSQFTVLASMKTKTLLAGAAVSAALLAPIAWQENAFAKARDERRELTLEIESPAAPASDQALDDLAQRERAELARLRREVGEFQARLDELNRRIAAAAVAAVSAPADPEPSPPVLATIGFANLRDAGQATPAALLETYFWATLHGDTNRLVQIMAIEPGMDPLLLEDQLSKIQKGPAEGRDVVFAKIQHREFRILEEQPADLPTDRWVENEFVEKQGNFRGSSRTHLLVRLTDTGWRLVLGLDGRPIDEKVAPVSQP
ncbi:MAG: hypothetical protein KIT22_17120, partial [Verrucomicrobiae bacterium]|nr:hypothetical protein [Verrucomicrobiae bacterium]